jgi:hypothetical protein
VFVVIAYACIAVSSIQMTRYACSAFHFHSASVSILPVWRTYRGNRLASVPPMIHPSSSSESSPSGNTFQAFTYPHFSVTHGKSDPYISRRAPNVSTSLRTQACVSS